jgi:hypothetical protein
MDDLRVLLDEREIGRLTTLALAQDTKDRAAYRRCFTDTIVLDTPIMPGWQPATISPDEWADQAMLILAGFDVTHHRLTNLIIDVDGNTASAAVDVRALHRVLDAEPDTLDIGGRHHLTLDRTPKGWLISSRALLGKRP